MLPRFLAELKHRNVYRAAVVYSAVGWMLLEAADVILPRLGLPDWSVNVVLATVLLCFPLLIVFAWVFDISPQGIVRTEPLPPPQAPPLKRTRYCGVCADLCTGDYCRLPLFGSTVFAETVHSALDGSSRKTSGGQSRAIPGHRGTAFC